MSWIVELTGAKSGLIYGYEVDAPKDEKEYNVAAAAFRQHGKLLRLGTVTEFARPTPGKTVWV